MSSGGAIGRGVEGLSADTLPTADGTVEMRLVARELTGSKEADNTRADGHPAQGPAL